MRAFPGVCGGDGDPFLEDRINLTKGRPDLVRGRPQEEAPDYDEDYDDTVYDYIRKMRDALGLGDDDKDPGDEELALMHAATVILVVDIHLRSSRDPRRLGGAEPDGRGDRRRAATSHRGP